MPRRSACNVRLVGGEPAVTRGCSKCSARFDRYETAQTSLRLDSGTSAMVQLRSWVVERPAATRSARRSTGASSGALLDHWHGRPNQESAKWESADRAVR